MTDSWWTPARAALVAIATVAVAVGGWFLYWKLYASATHHQAQIVRHNYEAQTSYRDEVQRQIDNVRTIDVQIASTTDPATKQALQAQRVAVVNQMCAISHRVDGGFDQPTTTFLSAECNGSQP